MEKRLNVIYFGGNAFPIGPATTKRRRYMVDYMNAHHIECHVLVTWHSGKSENEKDGEYGDCDYHDISYLYHFGNINKYYSQGKRWLEQWFRDGFHNVIVLGTEVEIVDYPLFKYAKRLGYKLVFDQVETNLINTAEHFHWKFKVHSKLNYLIRDKTHRLSDGSFVISKALYKENMELYPNIPLCILPNATPILQKNEKQRLSARPVLLYTGTFASKDGVKFLLEGFLAARKRGVNCKLILTGKGKTEDMQVLKLVENNPDVEYKGRVSDEELNRILLQSDILTMTRVNSKFANYGFPFKLSESLATGNPVIASDVSDVKEYVKHLESAYIVRPNSAKDIADGIQYLVEHPQEALRMGQNGLEVARTKFGIESVGKTFVDFLKTI